MIRFVVAACVVLGLVACGDNKKPKADAAVDTGCTTTDGKPGMACNGTCIDTTSDPLNCGACGTACTAGMACLGGTCSDSCPPGTDFCAGTCLDFSNDRDNCG